MKKVMVMAGPGLQEVLAAHEAVLAEFNERLELYFGVLTPNQDSKVRFGLEEVHPRVAALSNANLAEAARPPETEPKLRVIVSLVGDGRIVWTDCVAEGVRADQLATVVLGWLERWTLDLREQLFWHQTLSGLIANGLAWPGASLRVTWWGGLGVVVVAGAGGRARVAYGVHQTKAGWAVMESNGWPPLLAQGQSDVCVATDSQRANVLMLLTEAHARLEAEKWQC